MIQTKRMIDEFLELTRIDSLSLQEREMADRLMEKLKELGMEVYEDDAGRKSGGNAGNVIGTLPGNASLLPLLLMAHMDTVTPGTGRKAVVENGVVRSDGRTVLGGDDQAGIACILEAVRTLRESKVRHGEVQVVFSIGEEGGLNGSKNLDYSRIHAKMGIVLDSGGEIGTVDIIAPSQDKIDVVIKGKSAHAGLEPEKGIDAIRIAAHAISRMKLGRIDSETTANVGVIRGGQATNIVCEQVRIQAEARSLDNDKLRAQSEHMKECFLEAARVYGGTAEVAIERMYSSFHIEQSSPIIKVLEKAAQAAGVTLKLVPTGGGSDTNILNERGIPSVNISVGMDQVHTTQEQIKIADMEKAAEFLLSIIQNMPEESV